MENSVQRTKKNVQTMDPILLRYWSMPKWNEQKFLPYLNTHVGQKSVLLISLSNSIVFEYHVGGLRHLSYLTKKIVVLYLSCTNYISKLKVDKILFEHVLKCYSYLRCSLKYSIYAIQRYNNLYCYSQQ